MDEQIVYELLSRLVTDWDNIIVRVRQDGKMRFMPLPEVKDQRQVYKLVKDLMKLAAGKKGLLRKGGEG